MGDPVDRMILQPSEDGGQPGTRIAPIDLLGFHLACDADFRGIGLLYYVLNSSGLLGDALRLGRSAACIRAQLKAQG
jgi:hypothetical protein